MRALGEAVLAGVGMWACFTQGGREGIYINPMPIELFGLFRISSYDIR